MAANTIQVGAQSFPIHRGEHLLTPGYHTELELRVPPTTEGPKRTENVTGRVWLTDERIVFITSKPNVRNDDGLFPHRCDIPTFSSLIISYACLRDVKFKVPLFQANHMLLMFGPDMAYNVRNLPDPGQEANLVVRLDVAEGLGHSLYKRIEKERAEWAHRQRQAEPLPLYTPNPDYTAPPPGPPPA